MRTRLASFFRIDSQFDEIFWVLAILVVLYVVQLIQDGTFH